MTSDEQAATVSPAEPHLSIVIVSYNTAELTRRCIASVLESNIECSYEILVLDNASDDESPEMLAAIEHPQVSCELINENLGFAAGNNRAMQKAQGKLLLLLNPDTEVPKSAIQALLNFSGCHPNAGIWGGRTTFLDGSLNPTYCWGNQTIWSLTSQALGLSSLFRESSLFNPEGVGYWNKKSERIVDIVSGCFLLTTRQLWDRLGGFDSDFFMYGEETDFCNKAKQLGHQPMINTQATIVHHGGASEKSQAEKIIKLLTAKTRLIRRYFSPAIAPAGVSLLAAWPASRACIHAILAKLGRQRSKERFEVWHKVWKLRSQWITAT